MSGITITPDSGTQFEDGGAEYNSVCRLDDNHYAVAYRDNNTFNKGFVNVGSRTGTSVTINEANAVIFYNDSINLVSISAMSSTKVAIAFMDASTSIGYVVICTISGTTITVGTPVQVDSTHAINGCFIAALDSNNIVYTDDYQNIIRAFVGSVSGTTPSFGSAQSTVINGHWPSIITLDSTHIFIGYFYQSFGGAQGIVGSVNTGTQAITYGGAAIFISSFSPSGQSYNGPLLATFDSQHVIMGYTNSGASGYTDLGMASCEINLTTLVITVGSTIWNSLTSANDSNYSLCTMGASNFIISYYTTSGTKGQVRSGTLTGSNTIAFDAQGAVDFTTVGTDAYTSLCKLTSTDFILGYKSG